MMVKSFDFLMDVDILNSWLSSRGLETVGQHDLPSFGLMAYDQESLGCVFIRHCEKDLGMLCSFEINPHLPLRMKAKVMDELLMCAREMAHLKGMTKLFTVSSKRSILNRLWKNGWLMTRNSVMGTAMLEGV